MNQTFKTMGIYALVLILMALVVCPTGLGASGNGDKKKKKKTAPETAATPAVVIKPTPAPTPANGSLFTADAPAANLLGDFKARRVGDLVFVDIVEASAATVSSGASRARDSGTLGGLVGGVAAIPTPAAAVVSGVLNGMGQRKFEGKGSTQRSSKLQARIVARVVEVLPNGDLRIEADKVVKINKEDERLNLSGIVRQRDVSPDNAVATTSVGELKVALNGKGVASADNAPGWLFRLFDKISPF